MDYPASTLVPVKGKLYVSVTVPKEIEHLFKQKQIRLSTGTSDKKEARKRQHEVTARIYKRLDQAQSDHDKQLISDIHVLMQKLADGLGLEFEVAKIVLNDTTERRRLLNIIDGFTNEVAFDASIASSVKQEYEKLVPLAEEFRHENVQRYIDTFRDPEDRISVDLKLDANVQMDNTNGEQTVSALLDTYLESRQWSRLKSKDAARRQIKKFAAVADDPALQDIRKHDAYSFAKALESEGKAQKTISSYVSAVSAMLSWCEQNALLEESPFLNLKLANFGPKPKSWLPLSASDLHALFEQDMSVQDRLLLSILITTGMRLDEAALLTWEQLKFHENIRYFDLTDAILKNSASERYAPLPDCLKLPTPSTGRIFDYALDKDGKASKRASRVLGPIIRNATQNPRKVTHSLRGTLKDLLRNANVSKEINDFITGHSGGDVASNYGQGPSLRTRFEALNSVSHPWLQKESK